MLGGYRAERTNQELGGLAWVTASCRARRLTKTLPRPRRRNSERAGVPAARREAPRPIPEAHRAKESGLRPRCRAAPPPGLLPPSRPARLRATNPGHHI